MSVREGFFWEERRAVQGSSDKALDQKKHATGRKYSVVHEGYFYK